MQRAWPHAALIRIAALSSLVCLWAGCQPDKEKEAQRIDANLEALLAPKENDLEWLKGKRLSSIDSVIDQRQGKNLIFLFNYFDCQTCVKEGFVGVKQLNDSLGGDFVQVVSSRCLEVTSAQRQYHYRGYIHMDEKDRIRKELKYAPTPMLLILDDSCRIEDAFIFDSSVRNETVWTAFAQKCLAAARSVSNS